MPQPAAAPAPDPKTELPLPPRVQPVIAVAEPKPADPDVFAGLPRIRPFTEFELDPIEPTDDIAAPGTLRAVRGNQRDDEPVYTGRRRRADESEPQGRHAQRAEQPGSRHHHRDDELGDR